MVGTAATIILSLAPLLIKKAEELFASKPKSGGAKNDFVINTIGAAVDNLGKQGLVSPKDVAPVLRDVIEVVFKMLEERGEVNNNVDWGKRESKVIFEGTIRNAGVS